MDLKLKIYLTRDDEKFMGIGVLWLLEKVRASSSLRQAAMDMDISYTKAYTMIDNLEKALQVKVINRKKGGDSRNGASLTSFGEKLILLYKDFSDDIKQMSRQRFEPFKKQLQELISSQGDDNGQA